MLSKIKPIDKTLVLFYKVGQKNQNIDAQKPPPTSNQPQQPPPAQIVASSSSYTLPHSDSSSSLQQRDPTQSVPSLHTSTVQHQQHSMQQSINQMPMPMHNIQQQVPANMQQTVQHSASSSSVNFPPNSEPPNNFYFYNSGYLPPSTNPLAFQYAGPQRMPFSASHPELVFVKKLYFL